MAGNSGNCERRRAGQCVGGQAAAVYPLHRTALVTTAPTIMVSVGSAAASSAASNPNHAEADTDDALFLICAETNILTVKKSRMTI